MKSYGGCAGAYSPHPHPHPYLSLVEAALTRLLRSTFFVPFCPGGFLLSPETQKQGTPSGWSLGEPEDRPSLPTQTAEAPKFLGGPLQAPPLRWVQTESAVPC